MSQQESEDSNLIPLLFELAIAYVRANPSQASQDEFRHKLINAGVAPDSVSQILAEPTNLHKQPDPQPSIEVSEQSPSLLLYFALCVFAIFLIVLGFNIQAANWAGLILNLATEIIGAVLILIIVDKRLRRNELQAIQKYAESSSTRLSSIFIPDVRASVAYAKALSFELRRIQPKVYFVRKEYENLLEKDSGGILLYGVGGCGKSTLLQSIALKQVEHIKRQPRTTVRTILNRQWWNEGFSIITEANTNGGMRVSASASKNVRSIARSQIPIILPMRQSILRTKFEQVLGLKPSSCREQDLFF